MNMIDTEIYLHARQNMKFVTRSLLQADIFGFIQFTSR
jgi:hypothetical protein